MKGAEAVIVPVEFLGRKAVRKERREKAYRVPEIDLRIRLGRTKREARLLHKAKGAGVQCPTVYSVGKDYIVMERVEGRTLSEKKGELEKAGEMLGKLHSAGIVHGDFTPYNILIGRGGMAVIDFGLGSFSKKTEDRADDVITMLRGLGENGRGHFLEGYGRFSGATEVFLRMEKIEKRARYR